MVYNTLRYIASESFSDVFSTVLHKIELLPIDFLRIPQQGHLSSLDTLRINATPQCRTPSSVEPLPHQT